MLAEDDKVQAGAAQGIYNYDFHFYIFSWIIDRLMLSADSEDCEIDEQMASIQGILIIIIINKTNFRWIEQYQYELGMT